MRETSKPTEMAVEQPVSQGQLSHLLRLQRLPPGQLCRSNGPLETVRFWSSGWLR